MSSRRMARLNELIHQTISKLTLNLKDPAVGFITITGAEVTPDISLAKIYFSVLGSKQEREDTAKALGRAKPHFRRELAKLENLKKVPDLQFVYDDGVERADRVYRLLDTIQKEKNQNNAN